MAEQTFNLNFDGYWREPNISKIPSRSGEYCVNECTHNVSQGTVTIHRLLYIGEAIDVNDRVKNHEKWNEWRRLVNRGNELCFSFAPIESTYCERVEAALIFKHKPPLNTEYKNSFPFDRTTIITSGSKAKLHERFTVNRTP